MLVICYYYYYYERSDVVIVYYIILLLYIRYTIHMTIQRLRTCRGTTHAPRSKRDPSTLPVKRSRRRRRPSASRPAPPTRLALAVEVWLLWLADVRSPYSHGASSQSIATHRFRTVSNVNRSRYGRKSVSSRFPRSTADPRHREDHRPGRRNDQLNNNK